MLRWLQPPLTPVSLWVLQHARHAGHRVPSKHRAAPLTSKPPRLHARQLQVTCSLECISPTFYQRHGVASSWVGWQWRIALRPVSLHSHGVLGQLRWFSITLNELRASAG